MGLFKRIFRGKEEAAKTPPLSPYRHPLLGTLQWHADSEGWRRVLDGPAGPIVLHLGSGSASEYPAQAVCELLGVPVSRLEQTAAKALSYLRDAARTIPLHVDPSALRIDGLETFDHYVQTRTYAFTFSDGESETVWKVR